MYFSTGNILKINAGGAPYAGRRAPDSSSGSCSYEITTSTVTVSVHSGTSFSAYFSGNFHLQTFCAAAESNDSPLYISPNPHHSVIPPLARCAQNPGLPPPLLERNRTKGARAEREAIFLSASCASKRSVVVWGLRSNFHTTQRKVGINPNLSNDTIFFFSFQRCPGTFLAGITPHHARIMQTLLYQCPLTILTERGEHFHRDQDLRSGHVFSAVSV